MRPGRFVFSAILLFLLAAAAAQAAPSSRKELSLDEISKTEAARLYVSRQYSASLEAFQKLERLHPRSVLIKRYIASLYDLTGDKPQAVRKLRQALSLDPRDTVAMQMLAEIYMKQGDFENAAAQYEALTRIVPESLEAQNAVARLAEIDRLKAASKSREGQPDLQVFMNSDGAKAFSQGRYDEAIQGFHGFLREYPQDVLSRRFTGMSLMRMGRPKEALAEFDAALKIDPDNAALHYYRGLALSGLGKPEDMRREMQWVIAHDPGYYRAQAQRMLFSGLQAPPGVPKPWTFNATAGYEFDTNAAFRPRDPDTRNPGDQNSGRYITNFFGTYRFYKRGPWAITGDALYAQVLYNDFINLQTYTPGTGISALYAFRLFNQPAFLNLRDGVTQTYLKDQFFVFSNSLSPNLIFFPHPRLRTTLSYRWSYSEYGDNGSAPDKTSRDGFGNNFSISETFYINKAKSFYTTLGYDYDRSDTEGVDYVKNGNGAQLLLHFPIRFKVEGETTFRFRDSNYFKSSLVPSRRDDQYILGFSLSRPINRYFAVAATYSYENTFSSNNSYEYNKHVFGVQAAYKC